MVDEKLWSVIVQSKGDPDRWDPVASGDQEQTTNVVNLYHKKRPDLDDKVRLINPEGGIVSVVYGPTPLKDQLPLDP